MRTLTVGILRAKDAAAFLAVGKSTFWRWAREGRIPPGIRLSNRATVWRKSDLEDFIEQAAGQTSAGGAPW